MKIRFITILAVIFLFCEACVKEKVVTPEIKDTIINGRRIILFSGYEWEVETSAELSVGPGPNYFSASQENVFFDQNGRLHLKIIYKNNKWYCSKISLLKSHGHGKYLFYLDSRVDALDKNVVGGLFSYKNDQEEIDIEFSKWGMDINTNAVYSVQPSLLSGNRKNFNAVLTGTQSTHWFNWQSNRIDFASIQGRSSVLPASSNIIQQWSYSGGSIPPDTDETAKINLWLYKGVPPSNFREAEMIISGFEIL